MHEVFEFRIRDKFARKLNLPSEVVEQSFVRVVRLTRGAPLFEHICALERTVRSPRKGGIITSWSVRRHYTAAEMAEARLFRAKFGYLCETTGQDSGTHYDESSACKYCGIGRQQISNLVLAARQVPKADLFETLAGEYVLTERVARALDRCKFTGFKLSPVDVVGENGARKESSLLQLRVTSPCVQLVDPTIAGINPCVSGAIDQHRCPDGHPLALNLVSEAHIDGASFGGHNVVLSQQLFGAYAGLLRPSPMLFVSPNLREALVKERARGVSFEIARLH